MSLPISNLTLVQPGRIHFGAGCFASAVADLAAKQHRRVFIVTSSSVAKHAASLADILRNSGTTVETATGVPPEPTTVDCERLRSAARTFQPDLVVGLGGGSVLDVAKLVAALHDRDEPVSAFYGINVLQVRRTALACVATTAGTGSEVSPNALLFDEPTVTKKAVISRALVPDVAIVDPELMTTLPPSLTATTGIDALTHCLEAYANRAAHPMTDLYALEGVRLISGHLARAVANGADLEARTAVALGSLNGGLCLGPVNTAAVHALAYPLGGEFHLAHGLSIALLLPHVVRFNVTADPRRHAALAVAMGAARQSEPAATAAMLPGRLMDLVRASGIELGLARHGIPRDALPRIVDSALQVTRLLKNNPREVRRVDALAIYDAAF